MGEGKREKGKKKTRKKTQKARSTLKPKGDLPPPPFVGFLLGGFGEFFF